MKVSDASGQDITKYLAEGSLAMSDQIHNHKPSKASFGYIDTQQTGEQQMQLMGSNEQTAQLPGISSLCDAFKQSSEMTETIPGEVLMQLKQQ